MKTIFEAEPSEGQEKLENLVRKAEGLLADLIDFLTVESLDDPDEVYRMDLHMDNGASLIGSKMCFLICYGGIGVPDSENLSAKIRELLYSDEEHLAVRALWDMARNNPDAFDIPEKYRSEPYLTGSWLLAHIDRYVDHHPIASVMLQKKHKAAQCIRILDGYCTKSGYSAIPTGSLN